MQEPSPSFDMYDDLPIDVVGKSDIAREHEKLCKEIKELEEAMREDDAAENKQDVPQPKQDIQTPQVKQDVQNTGKTNFNVAEFLQHNKERKQAALAKVTETESANSESGCRFANPSEHGYGKSRAPSTGEHGYGKAYDGYTKPEEHGYVSTSHPYARKSRPRDEPKSYGPSRNYSFRNGSSRNARPDRRGNETRSSHSTSHSSRISRNNTQSPRIPVHSSRNNDRRSRNENRHSRGDRRRSPESLKVRDDHTVKHVGNVREVAKEPSMEHQASQLERQGPQFLKVFVITTHDADMLQRLRNAVQKCKFPVYDAMLNFAHAAQKLMPFKKERHSDLAEFLQAQTMTKFPDYAGLALSSWVRAKNCNVVFVFHLENAESLLKFGAETLHVGNVRPGDVHHFVPFDTNGDVMVDCVVNLVRSATSKFALQG